MRLVTLALNHFRNIREARLEPSPRLNIILGANGQGKTNLVEAIAFLSWLKSFRTQRTSDLIEQGQQGASIAASVLSRGVSRHLEVEVGPGFRRVFIDGRGVRSLKECMEAITVVFLSADDPLVLDGGPEGRRGLLDRACALLHPDHAEKTLQYSRLLKERNLILRKEERPSGQSLPPKERDDHLLEAVESSLANFGAQIALARKGMLEALLPLMREHLRLLTGLDLELNARYLAKWASDITDESSTRKALEEALAASRERDTTLGYTTIGPHTDDLLVEILGLPARGHASRGQRKALMLAWKAAEVTLFKEKHKDEPVLILDDALSDLDPERQERLLSWLSERPFQSFITGSTFPNVGGQEVVRFRVVAGRVEKWL